MASLWGHWRDGVGTQSPTTSWAGFDVATQIRNDSGSNLTKPNNSTVQVGEALPSGKAKLFVANIKITTTHNNRGNIQGRFVLSSGTGNLFTTYATGYVRNTNNNETWVRVIGVLTNCSLNAQVQLQWRRSSQSITIGTLANVSDLQVADLYFSEIGMYTDSTGGSSYGGTTRNTVNLDNTVQQTNTAAIERSGDTVTIKGDNKRYLILGSVAGATGGSRTQRISNIAYDGTAAEDTQSYAYQRNSSNPYAGMNPSDLYETSTTDVGVTLQCFRGEGVAADQGGANVDGSWSSVANQSGLCVIELDDNAEVFKSTDGTGLQDIAGGVTTTINGMRTEEFSDAGSYARTSNTAIRVEGNHNAFFWSNIFTARQTVSSGSRGLFGSRIEINGTDQTTGEHGKYTRGNQGAQDTFGGSYHAGGIYAVSDSDDVEVETFDAGDNGADDRTQPGSVSFYAINLDTTEPAASGVTGTADITLGAMTVSSTGTVSDPPISGDADITFDTLTTDGTGEPYTAWENFEDASSRLNQTSGTAAWAVNATGAYSGTNGLRYTGGATNSMQYDDTETYVPSSTFTYSGYVYLEAGGTNLSGLVLGAQAVAANGYHIVLDQRNGVAPGSTAALQIRTQASAASLIASTDSFTVNASEWYRIEVDWRTSGNTLTVRVYDEDNVLQGTLTTTDTTYTSGHLGVRAYNTTRFDNLRVSDNPVIFGDADITLGTLTLDATGVVSLNAITGDADITFGALTISSDGDVIVDGDADITLGTLTIDGVGVIGSVTTGNADITFGELTLSSEGDVIVAGDANITLGTLTLNSEGDVIADGDADITLGELTLTGAGTVTFTDISGNADINLGEMTLDGTGIVRTTFVPRRKGTGGRLQLQPKEEYIRESSKAFIQDKYRRQREDEEILLLAL